ncbi:MAG: hypothetical protein ACYDCJ_12935 [Gammaproteobacteria bacterium]
MSSLAGNKILLNNGAGIALGAPGSYYTAIQSVVLAPNASFVLPAGILFIVPVANVEVQFSTDGGTTWVTFYALGAGGTIHSDGFNWRLNDVTTGATAQYFAVA